jgi:penicillin G amidase
MRRAGKILAVFGIVILVIAVILAGVGMWFVRRPWTTVNGRQTVAGLSATVEVIRDEWGVPHIYADNEYDLFFAQGYVHAQDRLWQMEFNRRIASGTLSAAVGDSTLGTDIFLRTLGLRRAAARDWAEVDPDARVILEAYADGVNAYIEANRGRLPLEFMILGVDPEPWTPVDTLAWGKVMSFDLGGNYDFELLRARIIAELGEDAAGQLLPPYAPEGPVIIPPEARSYAWLRGGKFDGMEALADVLGDAGAKWGSNNWVVHGSRTATGKPLLADDMHLGLNMPSIWYENGLHGGRFDVVGYSFPGVPMIIVGHNARVAWAVTNLGPDVQDFYIEKLNDRDNPTQYEYMGEWRDLEIIPETIVVKDGEPVTIEVLVTWHGPIMNNAIGDLKGAEPLALRWTALEGGRLFRAVTLLNMAGNWDEFRAALRYWDVPSQNFIYADVDGHIGYQSPGRIPIRAEGHQGLAPAPGWTGEYEWLGYIPFDELPSVFDPPTGYIATANNKVTPDDYPYHIAYEWAAPYRAQRITDLLAGDESVTLDDMRNIHSQVYSLPAEALQPYLLAVEPASDLEAAALELAEDWDYCCDADCAGASIYQVWYQFMLRNTLGDELGDLLSAYEGKQYIHMPMMIEMMSDPDAAWFDDVRTPAVETRDDIVARSLSDTVIWLEERFGDKPAQWEWGKLHTMTFIHQPLGQSGIGILERIFNSKTIAARGDSLTVNAASYQFGESFEMTHGASQRMIVDLSNLENSRSIHTTGQSGQAFHTHREDFIDLWQNVEYHPMLFGRPAVEQNAEATLTLIPE